MTAAQQFAFGGHAGVHFKARCHLTTSCQLKTKVVANFRRGAVRLSALHEAPCLPHLKVRVTETWWFRAGLWYPQRVLVPGGSFFLSLTLPPSLSPSFSLFTPETQEARFVGYSLMQVYTFGAMTSKSCLRTYAGRSGQLHVHRGCCALARSWLRASWIVFHLNSSGACVNQCLCGSSDYVDYHRHAICDPLDDGLAAEARWEMCAATCWLPRQFVRPTCRFLPDRLSIMRVAMKTVACHMDSHTAGYTVSKPFWMS